MTWSFRISLNHPYKSLLAVFVIWKTLLLLLAVFSPGPGYDTSTTLGRLSPDATNADGDGPFTAILRLISTKLTRWDAIYFTEVASRGYIFEQEWAWGLGFTKLINFVANGEGRQTIQQSRLMIFQLSNRQAL
jgi:phosphatidylinositol glycan class V